MEDRIPPQPGEEGNRWGQLLTEGQQLETGIAAFTDHNQFPVGPPAAQTSQHLPGPVRDGLLAAAPCGMVAAGGGQHREKGPRPHPAEPAETRGLDEVAWDARTPSRYIPLAASCGPLRRTIVSSMPNRRGPVSRARYCSHRPRNT